MIELQKKNPVFFFVWFGFQVHTCGIWMVTAQGWNRSCTCRPTAQQHWIQAHPRPTPQLLATPRSGLHKVFLFLMSGTDVDLKFFAFIYISDWHSICHILELMLYWLCKNNLECFLLKCSESMYVASIYQIFGDLEFPCETIWAWYLFVWIVFFFFFFLGPHPLHIEVPRLGVETELQLPAYTHQQPSGIRALSSTYTTPHSNTRSLTH